jgi:hypothetical protein
MNGLLIKPVPSREEKFPSLPITRFLFKINITDGYLDKQFVAWELGCSSSASGRKETMPFSDSPYCVLQAWELSVCSVLNQIETAVQANLKPTFQKIGIDEHSPEILKWWVVQYLFVFQKQTRIFRSVNKCDDRRETPLPKPYLIRGEKIWTNYISFSYLWMKLVYETGI